jgi:hypothetical protein
MKTTIQKNYNMPRRSTGRDAYLPVCIPGYMNWPYIEVPGYPGYGYIGLTIFLVDPDAAVAGPAPRHIVSRVW